MSITINIYYKGSGDNAKRFAEEMDNSGIVAQIRSEEGNEEYRYFMPLDDQNTVLLIDKWKDQSALDAHHASPMMTQIAQLREKYDLHMTVERFASIDDIPSDESFIRK